MAIVNVHIDDDIYAHALALFNFRGKTANEMVQELFERAAYDELPVYGNNTFVADFKMKG